MTNKYKSGFITIVGRPNVGKSTFLNHAIGEKVSIISDKIQTTRTRVQGILTTNEAQLIFIDTPGVHKPKHRLGDYMVDVSMQTLNDADVVLFFINANEGYGKGDQFIIEKLKNLQKPIYLVINKVDLINPNDLFPLINQYKDKCDFEEIIPISALNGNNVEKLLNMVQENIPEGPQYFDEEQMTDHSTRFMISELIREKVLHHTEEEIPHSVNVIVQSFKQNKDQTDINATIVVERDSQKGIIIGKKGSMLKKIGSEARVDIEELIDDKVYLELWVKVQKDWRNKEAMLKQYGFDFDEF